MGQQLVPPPAHQVVPMIRPAGYGMYEVLLVGFRSHIPVTRKWLVPGARWARWKARRVYRSYVRAGR